MVNLIPSFFRKSSADIIVSAETKASNVAPLIFFATKKSSFNFHKGPDFTVLTKEAYQFNVIGNAAINARANAVASVELEAVDSKGNVLEDHDILELFRMPNVEQGQADFLKELKIIQIIGGEVFIEAVKTAKPTGRNIVPAKVAGAPKELWVHRPDRFTIKEGPTGVIGYTFQIGKDGKKKRFEANPITRESQILHLKNCNPLDDFRGLAEVISGGSAFDTLNALNIWNKTLIDNEARPSGILEQVDATRAVSEGDIEKLKQDIRNRFSGPHNAGEPMVIGGGWKWTTLGMNVKDMDFLNMKHSVSRDIALSLGVPPLMLDIPGDSTFNNKAEARQWFYEGPVMQDLKSLETQFNKWLSPMYDGDVRIRFNLDSHPAFADKRMKLFEMVKASEVMTIDERREKIGLPPLPEGGDVLLPPAKSNNDGDNE